MRVIQIVLVIVAAILVAGCEEQEAANTPPMSSPADNDAQLRASESESAPEEPPPLRQPSGLAIAADGGREETTGTGSSGVLQGTMRLIDGTPQSLADYRGKVVLVVNTASRCGFTPQYAGLQALHEQYANNGFVVLGFPSDSFNQELSSNEAVAEYCEDTFSVSFPMFEISPVLGENANPLFRRLAQASGQEPGWNFSKYLVGRDGEVIAYFSARQSPEDAGLRSAISTAIAAPGEQGGGSEAAPSSGAGAED